MNTRKLSIKTISTVSSLLNHTYKSHKALKKKVDNSLVTLHFDILQWNSHRGAIIMLVFKNKFQLLMHPDGNQPRRHGAN